MLRQFDINRNGQLTKGEVIGGVRTRFDTIDQNSDGAISELKYLEYRK